MSEKKSVDHFMIMLWLFAGWAIIFGLTLVTKAPTLARGVLPLISAAVVLWAAYWTIAAIRGRFTTAPQPTTTCPQENVQPKGRVVSKTQK